jgi:hypothetical protein
MWQAHVEIKPEVCSTCAEDTYMTCAVKSKVLQVLVQVVYKNTLGFRVLGFRV